MNFGKFDESKLFYIEASKVYKELGTGIKTVESVSYTHLDVYKRQI